MGGLLCLLLVVCRLATNLEDLVLKWSITCVALSFVARDQLGCWFSEPTFQARRVLNIVCPVTVRKARPQRVLLSISSPTLSCMSSVRYRYHKRGVCLHVRYEAGKYESPQHHYPITLAQCSLLPSPALVPSRQRLQAWARMIIAGRARRRARRASSTIAIFWRQKMVAVQVQRYVRRVTILQVSRCTNDDGTGAREWGCAKTGPLRSRGRINDCFL